MKLATQINTKIPRGERGEFLKITITMSPEQYGELRQFGLDQRIKGKKNTDTSSLIREAIGEFLNKEKSIPNKP